MPHYYVRTYESAELKEEHIECNALRLRLSMHEAQAVENQQQLQRLHSEQQRSEAFSLGMIQILTLHLPELVRRDQTSAFLCRSLHLIFLYYLIHDYHLFIFSLVHVYHLHSLYQPVIFSHLP